MPRRNNEFPIHRLEKINPIAGAIDIAYGVSGYRALAHEFKRCWALAKQWKYEQQPLPTNVLVRLITRLERGGIIRKEREAAIARAIAESEAREAAQSRILEKLRRMHAERKATKHRIGYFKPEPNPKRKRPKVLTEP